MRAVTGREFEPSAAVPQIAVGDVIALATAKGARFVQVTHRRPPYPDVVRALDLTGEAGSAGEAAARGTAFIAIVELGKLLSGGGVRHLGNAPVPEADRDYPRFRLAVRDRSGAVLYWWTWDGESLSIAAAGGERLPLREILPAERLAERLAAEIG